MDEIQSKEDKPKAKSKTLEAQLAQLKQREAAIVARRQDLEARVAKKQRSQRTRAFVCMGALIEKLMRDDDALRQRLLAAAAGENLHNRLGLGNYWPEFMPTAEEIDKAKSAKKSKKKKPADGENQNQVAADGDNQSQVPAEGENQDQITDDGENQGGESGQS